MSWHQYEEARSIEERGRQEIEKRQKCGETFEALIAPSGSKKMVTTFWGKAWCRNLESYTAYEARLPRGRSYLRKGNVYNLNVESGLIAALVLGGSIYEVSIKIKELDLEAWGRIQKQCVGTVGSLLDLLAGRLGAGVMEAICDKDSGLFPTPQEIRMSCSCPDWADMCKHVAAVLYGVGVKFDADPSLLFKLRHVDPLELFVDSGRKALSEISDVDGELQGEDLGALFGITLDVGSAPIFEEKDRDTGSGTGSSKLIERPPGEQAIEQ